MKLRHKELVAKQLVKIEEIELNIKLYDKLTRFIRENSSIKQVNNDILEALIRIELEEYRKLFMWSLFLEDSEQTAIRQKAVERFNV